MMRLWTNIKKNIFYLFAYKAIAKYFKSSNVHAV